ncbi:MAG: four-carbon acid sugar kinase family protein [Candidatus Didemnitutus sp.]|nr:four-carbon acid sugar kinase family protein [Candidatus Didemnitutus sp.]
MTAASAQLRLAYFGDDFTGSTDALEFLSRAGLRTALFLAPPSRERLAALPGLDAIGVAGLTRSLPPGEMEAVLRPAFAALRELRPRHVHYKVCSTFDSSPTVGSIGRAIEVGAEIFPGRYVPLLVGAPALGRFCAFGNLFARLGIGSSGEIHRLDRHPAMSRHPVTPADEADLRLHLTRQTTKRIGLLDTEALDSGPAASRAALGRALAAGAEIVLFDVMREEQLARIGGLIDELATEREPVFSVGSSGIEMALGAHWTEQGSVASHQVWPRATAVDRLLVLSGSCSPVTAGQIDWALAHGFVGVPLDAQTPQIEPAVAAARDALRDGKSPVVFTARGTPTGAPASAAAVGAALGAIARVLAESESLSRVLVAGGDTSSYAARALGIDAVEMIARLAPGAPLCRAHSGHRGVHGLEINFKGGQVGPADYFAAVRDGGA